MRMESGQSRTSSSTILFLTGCVSPNGMHFTDLQDIDERRQQYIDAINFYLTNTSARILFVENSGVDLSSNFQTEINAGRMEILTFNGNDYDRSLGKGYGEMKIIEHALKASRFLAEASFVFKVTGRYKVLNIRSFLLQHEQVPQINVIADLKLKRQYVDSRIFGCTPSFYIYLLQYRHDVNDSQSYFFEKALFCGLLDALKSGYSYDPFKAKPRFQGISGTDNKAMKHSMLFWWPRNIKQRLKHALAT